METLKAFFHQDMQEVPTTKYLFSIPGWIFSYHSDLTALSTLVDSYLILFHGWSSITLTLGLQSNVICEVRKTAVHAQRSGGGGWEEEILSRVLPFLSPSCLDSGNVDHQRPSPPLPFIVNILFIENLTTTWQTNSCRKNWNQLLCQEQSETARSSVTNETLTLANINQRPVCLSLATLKV